MLCSVVPSGAIVSFCSADSLAALSVPADVVPPHAVNPVITMAAVNTAHITFVFTWGKFHLLIFSFLLFHSFLKKLVNIYFPLSASYDKGHLRRNCEKNVVIL